MPDVSALAADAVGSYVFSPFICPVWMNNAILYLIDVACNKIIIDLEIS